MFDCIRDWQWWIPVGVALLSSALGVFLSLAIYRFAFRNKPESESDLSDHPLVVTAICLVFAFAMFGGLAAGYWIGEKVDPVYFSKETVCASCGATILKTDEYCTDCGYEQTPTCDGCGTAIRDGSGFCANCGTKVSEK